MALLWSAAIAACSGPSHSHSDSLPDGSIPFAESAFSVSGNAVVEPAAEAWMADAGLTVPSLAGAVVQLEDPMLAVLEDPHASFGVEVLDGGSSFFFSEVRSEDVVSGLSVAMDRADAGWIPSSCILQDSARVGAKPRADLTNLRAYALPRAFHDRLSDAVGSVVLSALSDAGTLEESGFGLFRILDGQGAPLSGVKLSVHPGSSGSVADAQLFYPSDDFFTVSSAGSGSTGQHGLALVVNSSPDPDLPTQFSVTVVDHPEYPPHSAFLRRGYGQVVNVWPTP